MINRKIVISVLFLLSMFILSACSTSTEKLGQSSSDASSGNNNVKELVITSFNYGFTQQPVEIKKGDKVKLIVKSTSGVHGVEIPELGVFSGPASPGTDNVVEFVATKSGTFNYFCNIPCGSGHTGMKGQIVVK